MPSFNKVIIAGHLTRDPEIRYTPKGTPIARFALGVNHTWKSESGEKMEEVSFFDVTAFGKQGETIAQHVKKGAPLLVEGRLKQESWEDKETKENRHKVVIVLESFTFLGGKKDDGKPEKNSRSKSAEKSDAEKDDVPF